MSSAPAPKLTTTHWLIIVIASIGFLFDTYELLMTPLTAPPAIAELLGVDMTHPAVTEWTGKLLWITALCGGIFGLIGGKLTDVLGRKFVMAASIFVYSFSPFCAAYSTSLGMFIFFRSLTFIGVCVEFVAAITWLAEVFEDKHQKEKWLGITQAFASLGGLLVTAINVWILANMKDLPSLGLPAASSWRYLLMTGILPAVPIALMLPFVPESKIWKEKKAAGQLKRASIGQLFAPELRRVTLVTAILSACAYGLAFGALQITPLRIAPGLPELAETSKKMAPLRKQAAEQAVAASKAAPNSPEQAEAKTKLAEVKAEMAPLDKEVKAMGNKVQFSQELGGLLGRILLACLLATMIAKARWKLTPILLSGFALWVLDCVASLLTAENALVWNIALRGRWMETLGIVVLTFVLLRYFVKQDWPLKKLISFILLCTLLIILLRLIFISASDYELLLRAIGSVSNYWLVNLAWVVGLCLAWFFGVLLLTKLVPNTARGLLAVFQVPALILLPLTYLHFFQSGGSGFMWAYALCGLVTVAQFSYFGEYLPKVFPMHLRGTGGSFATNVGGRMIGTSMAFVTTNLVAPMISGDPTKILPIHLAKAAGYVGLGIALLALVVGMFLPEPKSEE